MSNKIGNEYSASSDLALTRILFAVSFALSTLFVAADFLGLLQLLIDLWPVVSRPVCCFCLFGLEAWLVDHQKTRE